VRARAELSRDRCAVGSNLATSRFERRELSRALEPSRREIQKASERERSSSLLVLDEEETIVRLSHS